VLRVPKTRVADTERLSGQTLDVAGNPLRVDAASVRRLSPLTTQFSRYVVLARTEDENAFMAEALTQLRGLGVQPKKMLCGIEHSIATPDGPLRTRSLMLAELTPAEALTLQQRGLGPLRHLGCGLFIPHKDIKELAMRE
jgi:CRISPR-associated protein Cas6